MIELAPALALFPLGPARPLGSGRNGVFDVRAYGAAGDGTTIDTTAINRAVVAAAAAGGGTVLLPPGVYASYSIRLLSRVTLHLARGATLLAATPGPGADHRFDRAVPAGHWARYQDFGHDHWHDSLIWGEGLHDVAIEGPGIIRGSGLSHGLGHEAGLPPPDAPGAGDKTIALKRCRNVALRDLNIVDGGHIAFLATGVDNLTVENVTIDTDRDGMNIDCCRNVTITSSRVNSPWDDGIALKSSFALGEIRLTENVTISDCTITGCYRLGTLVGGSRRLFPGNRGPYRASPVGRIKCGTESIGGFRNIAITNCRFEGCRGLAIECVDGGTAEDITISGLVMRDLRNAPFFIRLGARMRGPPGRAVGVVRRVRISDVVCEAAHSAMPAIISGIPDRPVEDIFLSNIRITGEGGGTPEMAAIVPREDIRSYPEPTVLGPLPAQGVFIRHARNVVIRDLAFESRLPDARPFVWMADVDGVDAIGLKLPPVPRAPSFLLEQVRDFRCADCSDVRAQTLPTVGRRVLP